MHRRNDRIAGDLCERVGALGAEMLDDGDVSRRPAPTPALVGLLADAASLTRIETGLARAAAGSPAQSSLSASALE